MLVAAAALAGGALLAACGDDGGEVAEPTLSAAGERGKVAAQDLGCFSCHTTNGERGTGPTWLGLAGSERPLEGGDTVVADDDYLERAILDPRSEVVEGYANIMPVYERQVSDEELADLLAYLRDLAEPAGS